MKFKQDSSDLPDELIRKSIRKRIEDPVTMINDRSTPKVETTGQPEGDYETDLKKLQALSQEELRKLLTQVEETRRQKSFGSRGDLLNGYAIDSKTLQSLQSSEHYGIDFALATEISEELKSIDNYDLGFLEVMHDVRRRIVKGMVYLKVPGFKTPVVKLWLGSKEMGDEVPKEDIARILDYIKSERKLLPINQSFSAL